MGFAAKAGKLSYGFEAAVSSIKSNKARLLLVANDISQKSLKEAKYFADKANVKHILLKDYDIKTLSDAVGRKCGIITVNDIGFADACAKLIDCE